MALPKIHWLVQAAEAQAPAGLPGETVFLSPGERERCQSLHCEKRRRDWLLGRWTAKRLLQAYIWQASGRLLPLSDLSIENDHHRAPYGVARFPIGWQPLVASLTISHSHGHALSAVVAGERWVVGGDLERIEPRSPAFIDDYFTPIEAAQVRQAPEQRQALLTTAIWSAKEAVLKSLHLGLSVDTRGITCRFDRLDDRPAAWQPFAIDLARERLPHGPSALHGWWRTWDHFVLTLALRPAW